MKRYRRPSRAKKVAGIILLAVICIGGAELLVCRIVAPDLYAQMTAPVRETLGTWGEKVGATLSEWTTPPEPNPEPDPEELPESQYVTDPAIWTDSADRDPALTTLEIRNGKEVLTGGSAEVVYYNQADPKWSNLPYGSDTIGKYGCGPVVMAMAVSTLTDQEMDPGTMANWAKANGYWARRSGSYLSIIEGTATAFGLSVESCQVLEPDRLRQELASGKIAVALVTKGHFTNGGHFILLRGVTLEGDVLVADPASQELSLLTWDAQLILNELSSSRNDGAPLWLLSPAHPLEADED